MLTREDGPGAIRTGATPRLLRWGMSGIWLLIMLDSSEARAAQPLSVQALVPKGAYYVGQAVELRIGVEAAGERPKVFTPRVEDAEVTPGKTELRQRGSSAIGEVVSERIYYIFRFRVVPHRAGPLLIPPVTVRLGERSGSSETQRLTIRDLPAAGRPAAFLGGVGGLRVDAKAQPSTVRAGQSLEYRIWLEGPAARGSTLPPNLDGFKRVPLALKVEPLAPEAVADPPSRVFRYSVRPTRAGEAALPPVAISYFDPKAARYLTTTTASVPIHVVDVLRFDPNRLEYSAAHDVAPPGGQALVDKFWNLRWMSPVLGSLVAFLGLFGVFAFIRRTHRRLSADPSRYARRVARRLNPALEADAAAGTITNELTRYLKRATGRPEGVLTPLDAETALESISDDRALAECAGRLIAECDQVRYGGRRASVADLVGEARGLFSALGSLRLERATSS